VAAEDVEVARRANDLFARGDADAWRELHHPDCEFMPMIVAAEGGGPYRGHEGCRSFWRDIHAVFEDWHPTVEQVRDHGDAVVLEIRFEGRGRQSGAPVDQRVWQAMRVRDGRVAWWRIYASEREALEAVD
jgi:ketosteroid isomerase-like protein